MSNSSLRVAKNKHMSIIIKEIKNRSTDFFTTLDTLNQSFQSCFNSTGKNMLPERVE